MFLDIRTTLATFCTAIGLALVMFAVGTRTWVGVGSAESAVRAFEVRALTAHDPIERGFSASPAVARSVSGVAPATTAPVSLQTLLPPAKTEPFRPAERVTGRETPSPAQPTSSVMPGAGAVVQERFDVLHEPAGQVVPPRGPIAAGIGNPLVPLPRPRGTEPSATPASASIAGPEQAADQARPKTTLGVSKRAEAPAKKRPPRQTVSGYFNSLFGR